MGHYTVWILPGLPPSETALQQAEEMIQPYSEMDNDIPGQWPGLSFDYYEIEQTGLTAAQALQRFNKGETPAAIITPEGQINFLDQSAYQPELREEYINLISLPEAHAAALETLSAQPEAAAVIMNWHG